MMKVFTNDVNKKEGYLVKTDLQKDLWNSTNIYNQWYLHKVYTSTFFRWRMSDSSEPWSQTNLYYNYKVVYIITSVFKVLIPLRSFGNENFIIYLWDSGDSGFMWHTLAFSKNLMERINYWNTDSQLNSS